MVQVEYEHTALHVYGSMKEEINHLIFRQRFSCVLDKHPNNSFVRRNQLQIELIPVNTPEHEGWATNSKPNFYLLCSSLSKDQSNFKHLVKHDVREEDLLASIFQHTSGMCIQIIYRTKPVFE